jgi:predicted ATPase
MSRPIVGYTLLTKQYSEARYGSQIFEASENRMSDVIASRYEVLSEVDTGGQGRLLQALDRRHQRLVAIKLLTSRKGGTVADLVAEAGVLLRLRPHVGIPVIREDFFLEDQYAIVMDWVAGRDLGRVLVTQGDPGLPFTTALNYIEHAAAALDHLHQHDPPVIHGDVKPTNLILTPEDRIVLVDFGIASFGSESRRAGSRGFVAPEIAAGESVTPATDIYSLAATAVALLTGAPPAPDTEWGGTEPEIDRRIIRSLRRALSIDPERRPSTAGELAERLRAGRAALPSGIVTFLGTDVSNAPTLWVTNSEAMTEVCDRLGDLVCEIVESHGGHVVKSTGEDVSTLSVFTEASSAVAAALALHRCVGDASWPPGFDISLRVALRTGEAQLRDGGYVGATVNRVASLRQSCPLAGTVACQTTVDLVGHRLPDGHLLEVASLGDAAEPDQQERVYTLTKARPRTSIDRLTTQIGVWLMATDIEASTSVLEVSGDRYRALIESYRKRLQALSDAEGASLLSLVDDTAVLAFSTASQAIASALDLLTDEGCEGPKIRVGIHLEAERDDPWAIDTVTSAGVLAVCRAGHGGQVLVSDIARPLLQAIPDVKLVDVGVHRLSDLSQPQRLFQAVHPRLGTDSRPPRSLDTRANNLPIQLTRFVGRRAEVEHVADLVLENRLCTITGTGGAGKTRLALQVAGEVLASFRDGVWFVELSGVEGRHAAAVVATAVGVREGGSGTFAAPGRRGRRSAVDRLIDHLEDRAALLVLDGCEHMLDACRDLANQILRAAPRVTVLVTSRALLELHGEATFRLGPLSVPSPEATPEEARQSASVCLFVDRASLRRPDLVMDDVATEAVATICRQVEGIPLAIELAAARVTVLALPKLASMLEDRLGLLADNSPAVVARQATLRATIEWSEATLSEQERILFRRLAVFAGGFGLDAAQQVCSGRGLEQFEVLDVLASLVDKSLIETDASSADVRYRLLDATRQFAAERCSEASEELPTRTAHVAWCLGLAERAEEELSGPRQAECLQELDRDYENLCAAMRTAVAGAAPDDLRIAAALGHYWLVRGLVSEGSSWLASALERREQAPAPLLAKALCAAAVLACFAGNYSVAEELASRTLAISSQLIGQRWRGRALGLLGLAHSGEGRVELALQRQLEAIDVERQSDDPWGTAFAINNAANLLALQGAGGAAYQYYEEALRIRRAREDTWGVSWTLFRLGSLVAWRGDFEHAIELLTESLAAARSLRYGQGTLLAVLGLAEAHELRGASDDAQQHYRDALSSARELEEPTAACLALAGLAAVAVARGDRAAAETALTADDFRDDPSLVTRAALLRGRAQLAELDGDLATAEAWHREALLVRRELGDYRAVVEELEALGCIAYIVGASHRAAILLGAATAQRAEMGYPVPPRYREAVTSTYGKVAPDDPSRDQRMNLQEAFRVAITPG